LIVIKRITKQKLVKTKIKITKIVKNFKFIVIPFVLIL
jgi:hypothetical protein